MRTQGHVIRTILEEAIDPESPEELAVALGQRFKLDLEPSPPRRRSLEAGGRREHASLKGASTVS